MALTYDGNPTDGPARRNCFVRFLLLLCGNIQPNPDPQCMSFGKYNGASKNMARLIPALWPF